MKKRILLIISGIIILLAAAFLIYTGHYYHADADALAALESDDVVHVESTDYGWFFDGPADTDALIFYPGAKVEETAYAPLLRLIAEHGMDVCLMKMPFRLAVFGINSADKVLHKYDYASWYIGGHSLGGTIAADYASRHSEELSGIILLASYSLKKLDDSLEVISIYGSEDGVLNMAKLQKQDECLPSDRKQYVIEGGNHAQFGNYGIQSGDGDASITAKEQQRQTAVYVMHLLST